MGKYSDKSLKVSRKYLLHAKFEVAERIWFYLIPTAQGRVKWLRKHKKLAMLGEHVHWQPRKYPTDGNMLKVHDNVAIASNVEFTMHDIIHWIFDGMEGHRCFQEFADCIEINENVFIGAGARILPGVSVGPNAIVAAGAIVNKDVLPGTVVGGVPARVIGSFEDLMKNRKMYSDMIQSVIMLVLLLRMYEIKQKQLKIKIGYFVMLGLLGVIVAWNQLVFYFTTTTEARSILLYVGIDLFKKYFPLGAGLATFGTAAAQKYYSPVYGIYGLSNRHGFTFDNPLYLTDNFWPAVIGETGLIGLVVFLVTLYFAFKYLYKKCNQTNMSRMIIIFFIVTILSSSIATSIFAQNATVADIFYICMIPAILRRERIIYG